MSTVVADSVNGAAETTLSAGGIASPGTLLADQRREYGWTVKEVAAAMRLSERQVDAIEADEYDSLPGKTYVMGYWRSYSQLLRIDIDDSIQVHRANLASDVREFNLEASHQQIQGSEEQSRKRAAALFACLLAVFLGAVWYWQDPDASLTDWVSSGINSITSDESAQTVGTGDAIEPLVLPESESASAPTQSVLALPEPNFSEGQQAVAINTRGYEVMISELPLSRRDLIYQPWPEEDPALAAVTDVEENSVNTVEATNEPDNAAILAAAAAAAAEAKRIAAREAAAQQAAEQQAAAQQTAAQQAAANQVAASQTSTPEATSGGGRQISFQVAKESWIDVRDSTGERLIYRTVNRGEDIRLSGIPPYSIFIGSAEGVAVQYQGRAVPFKIHESGLFARFEVGSGQ